MANEKTWERRPQFNTGKCLVCTELYYPEGIGDRVCPDCKVSNNWRNGSFVGPYFSPLK